MLLFHLQQVPNLPSNYLGILGTVYPFISFFVFCPVSAVSAFCPAYVPIPPQSPSFPAAGLFVNVCGYFQLFHLEMPLKEIVASHRLGSKAQVPHLQASRFSPPCGPTHCSLQGHLSADVASFARTGLFSIYRTQAIRYR